MDMIVIYQILSATFIATALFASGYFLGQRTSTRKYNLRSAHDRDEMLTIERALKQFWDHEREKLQQEKQELQRHIQFLEERLNQYRRKAAGIGIMGLRKSKMTDMLISLLVENETLEEKLFLQNLKLKEERDEFLKNEMRHISYKRVLLSELISQSEVRRELERIINDKGRWKRLDFKHSDIAPLLSDPQLDEMTTNGSGNGNGSLEDEETKRELG